MRWQMEMNSAKMLTSGSVGNPISSTDDVWIDGNIITAENWDSASRFAELIAQSVASNRE
jgi:putative intracellular protease/amidase